jgi:hypothetical protein
MVKIRPQQQNKIKIKIQDNTSITKGKTFATVKRALLKFNFKRKKKRKRPQVSQTVAIVFIRSWTTKQ